MSAAAPAGNVYDKQGTRNPLARALVRRFEGVLDGLVGEVAPGSILDVGCGEGDHAVRWALRPGVERVQGIDLPDRRLAREWERRTLDGEPAGLSFEAFDGGRLPYGDAEFDLVAAVEVLEHVADPRALLGELLRCTRSHLLLSVPREPLWRALNLVRGAYLRRLGDTPGHLHHWSRRDFIGFLDPHVDVVTVRTPLPWTVVLCNRR